MTGKTQTQTVGELPAPEDEPSRVARLLTRLVWALWIVSLGALAASLLHGDPVRFGGVVAVDGLTVAMWVTVTFFSGIVHSYSRRYMAGSRSMGGFFTRVFAFTLVVCLLVAADSLVLFGAAWLAMGLLMADLIGYADGWPQAQAAASVARRSFLASTALLSAAVGILWLSTGATRVADLDAAVNAAPPAVSLVTAGALVLAAMVQSALVPFHRWLLSSMTAPTPASALMHAGFVNAGGILLVRFGPVVTVDDRVMLGIVVVGAVSALAGKLLKSVQTAAKSKLGCSTVGQMGFMIMQVGLGFFAAAITHLILHGFYKAYKFLSSGEQVDHKSPTPSTEPRSLTAAGLVVTLLTGAAGAVLFAVLTGKGTKLDSGLLLTLLVVLTVLHAAREVVTRTAVPATVRYAAVPAVALPAIAIYAGLFQLLGVLLADLPATGRPTELSLVHGLVAAAFLAAYLAIETGAYRRSRRLYVALLNASQPHSQTLLTNTEEYNEY